jgi:hypothetical protein
VSGRQAAPGEERRRRLRRRCKPGGRGRAGSSIQHLRPNRTCLRRGASLFDVSQQPTAELSAAAVRLWVRRWLHGGCCGHTCATVDTQTMYKCSCRCCQKMKQPRSQRGNKKMQAAPNPPSAGRRALQGCLFHRHGPGDHRGLQEWVGVIAPSAAAASTAQVCACEAAPGLRCQCCRPHPASCRLPASWALRRYRRRPPSVGGRAGGRSRCS